MVWQFDLGNLIYSLRSYKSSKWGSLGSCMPFINGINDTCLLRMNTVWVARPVHFWSPSLIAWFMGPTGPRWAHVGPTNFAIWDSIAKWFLNHHPHHIQALCKSGSFSASSSHCCELKNDHENNTARVRRGHGKTVDLLVLETEEI